MKKLVDGVYIHRRHLITKDEQGICVEDNLEIFPTWNDAREYVNKIMDGTHKKEPRIIGMWSMDNCPRYKEKGKIRETTALK